ncbi:hypothetical protein [Aerosakkonema funiforme]
MAAISQAMLSEARQGTEFLIEISISSNKTQPQTNPLTAKISES